LEEAAAGILKIVINNMAGAIETMTVKRGIDPRECTMVSFGGAGPLHGPAIAREIGIPEIIVSTMPGNFSAWGMLMADLKHDYVKTLIKLIDDIRADELSAIFTNLEEKAIKTLKEERVQEKDMQFVYGLDMRYLGQGHSLTIPLSSKLVTVEDRDKIKETFDEMYLRAYLHNAPKEPKEVVSVRLTVFGLVAKANLREIKSGSEKPDLDSVKEQRKVYLSDGYELCTVYDRRRLFAHNQIEGPALVEEETSTTLIWPGQVATVDEYGHLRIKNLSS
jgi:N-methylhydantoinase A